MLSEIRKAIRDYTWERKDIIDAALAPFGVGTLQAFYTFEEGVVEISQFPCIVLENPERTSQYIAAPYLVERRFEFPVVGFTLHDEPETNADAISAMADAFSKIWEAMPPEGIPVDLFTMGYQLKAHPGERDVPFGEYKMSFQAVGENNRAYLRIFEGPLALYLDSSAGAIT